MALGPDTRFEIDQRLQLMARQRRVALQVSDFDSALRMIRGNSIIITLPDCLAPGLAADVGHVAPPPPPELRSVSCTGTRAGRARRGTGSDARRSAKSGNRPKLRSRGVRAPEREGFLTQVALRTRAGLESWHRLLPSAAYRVPRPGISHWHWHGAQAAVHSGAGARSPPAPGFWRRCAGQGGTPHRCPPRTVPTAAAA